MNILVNAKLTSMTISEVLTLFKVSVRTKKILKLENRLVVNGKIKPSNYKLELGDRLEVKFPEEVNNSVPVNISLEHYYEDDLYLVVDKPVGMACGGYSQKEMSTVANAISYHYQQINHQGAVHFSKNEDRDVSGLLLISKTSYAQSQMEKKGENATRTYRCLVQGMMKEKGNCTIQLGVVRDGHKKRRIVSRTGLQAVTKYEIIGYIGNMTIVECVAVTEVTHQIRVHLSEIGHPIVGDKVYGGVDTGEKMYFECVKIEFYNRVLDKMITVEKEPLY